MCEKHYSIMMMGEDSTDDLQEREDALANAMAEYDAVQDGGLGGYYDDDNYGYNYQDSNPLTDIDYQPTDESSAFTGNYTGADDYDPVARDSKEDGSNSYGDTNDSRYGYSDDEDFDGDGGNYDRDAENYDGDENDKSEDDEYDAEDEEDEEEYDESNEDTGNNGYRKDDPYEGIITWHPGDEITVELLAFAWVELRQIGKLKPLIEVANESIVTALNTLGPNLILNFNKYLERMNVQDEDMIGTLLKLVDKNGRRLGMTSVAVLEALFDAQWSQVFLIATLPTAFKSALNFPALKKILQKLFEVGVPLVNQKYRVGKKSFVSKVKDLVSRKKK